MKRILIDSHHQGLTESLHLLFADRLGYEAFIQVGMEWREQGYWNVQPFEVTAKQFLEIGSQPYPEFNPINQPVKQEDGIFYVKDSSTGRIQKGITYQKFLATDFDLILASIPQHAEPFKRLAEMKHCPAVMQIGNAWSFDTSFPIKNILASAIIPDLPGFNTCVYHQEFDLGVFHYEPPKEGKKIYSFINCLGQVDIYKQDWELFLELERLMPDWEFKSFGGLCRDGSFANVRDVADKMREATFIFHCKTNGDGYGHVIHQAAAVGRPLITRHSDYRGKLAEHLLSPGATSVFVDKEVGATPRAVADLLRFLYTSYNNKGERNISFMSSNISQKFKETINFDTEQKSIENFLSRLQ